MDEANIVVTSSNRTAGDLIEELNKHAASGRYNIGTALILTRIHGGELQTRAIDAASDRSLRRLIELGREGGCPLGFAGFWTTPLAEGGVRMEMEGWLLDEYQGDDRAEETFETALTYYASQIREDR